MDVSPTVAEPVRVVTLDMEALLGVVLQDRNRVVAAFDQQVHGLRSEKRRIKSIEKDRTPAPLRMSDFSDENCFRCRLPPAIKLKIPAPQGLNKPLAKRFRGAGQCDIAR